jgi:hypothetical protein
LFCSDDELAVILDYLHWAGAVGRTETERLRESQQP